MRWSPASRRRAWRSTRPTASRRSRAGMSSDVAFLDRGGVDRRPRRGRRGLARRPLQLDRRGRRPGAAVAAGVPRARAEALRRDRGRRPVPRAACRRHRRRGGPPNGRRRAAARRSRARRRCRRAGATASTPAVSASRGRPRTPHGSSTMRSCGGRPPSRRRGATATRSRALSGRDHGQRRDDPRVARARGALDDPALTRERAGGGRRADRQREGHRARMVVGGSLASLPRATCAGSRTARRGSAGRCSSSSRRPETSGSVRPPRAPSRTSGRGSTRTRGPGPICAPAGDGPRRGTSRPQRPGRGVTARRASR